MDVSAIRSTPPPPTEVAAQVKLTPGVALKYAVATALMVAALYYLSKGRKEANLSYMITGGVLAIVCCAVAVL